MTAGEWQSTGGQESWLQELGEYLLAHGAGGPEEVHGIIDRWPAPGPPAVGPRRCHCTRIVLNGIQELVSRSTVVCAPGPLTPLRVSTKAFTQQEVRKVVMT